MQPFIPHQPASDVIAKRDITEVQRAVALAMNKLTAFPLNDGALLESVALVTGSTNLVPHGLGRKFRTWMLLDLQASATVYRDTTSTADLAIYLPILTTANVTLDIAVF